MKTIRLEDIKKERMAMEGAEKVFKQVPISKESGSHLSVSACLQLNRTVILLITPMILSI